ncbi:hypothetical protein SLE2022_232460 [Rubroshorea leprosula]
MLLFGAWAESTLTVDTCYEILRAKNRKVYKVVWTKHIIPRHSFILWMAALGRLKTKVPFEVERRGYVPWILSVLSAGLQQKISGTFFSPLRSAMKYGEDP